MYVYGIHYARMKTPTTLASILQALAQIQRLDRGSVSILRQGPNGPYYNHQCYENGRNVSRYVPADQVAELQAALADYQRFQQLVQQYVELLVQQVMAQFQGQNPTGVAVQQLEGLLRTALFKPATALVGFLLQGAADRIDAAYQPRRARPARGGKPARSRVYSAPSPWRAITTIMPAKHRAIIRPMRRWVWKRAPPRLWRAWCAWRGPMKPATRRPKTISGKPTAFRCRRGKFSAWSHGRARRPKPGRTGRLSPAGARCPSSKETMTYLATHPNRFRYLDTPKHGSWLNLVETLFGKMARTFLRGLRVAKWAELKTRILLGMAANNQAPVVHRWRKFTALETAQ